MVQPLHILSSVRAASLLPIVLVLPAPQINLLPNIRNKSDIGGVDPTPLSFTTVTSTSGSLYGPTSLLDEITPPVTGGPSTKVSNYELVNGQEADSNIDLYLNFNSAENPQTLKGDSSQTDPGPRIIGTYGYEKINPDIFAPPGTDGRDVPQAMCPLGLSHNRL